MVICQASYGKQFRQCLFLLSCSAWGFPSHTDVPAQSQGRSAEPDVVLKNPPPAALVSVNQITRGHFPGDSTFFTIGFFSLYLETFYNCLVYKISVGIGHLRDQRKSVRIILK